MNWIVLIPDCSYTEDHLYIYIYIYILLIIVLSKEFIVNNFWSDKGYFQAFLFRFLNVLFYINHKSNVIFLSKVIQLYCICLWPLRGTSTPTSSTLTHRATLEYFLKTLKNNPQKAPAADNGAAAQQMNSWGFRFPPMIITVRSAICQKPGTTLDNPQNISVALCGVRVGRVSGDASFCGGQWPDNSRAS